MEEFGKIIRAPGLKRGKIEEKITSRIKLERVLGVTVGSNAALDSESNGTIAYPAGCTVVLFNTKTEQQHHIINTCRKTITSLAFSSCGRYIVTGECGHQPAVRVWDLYSDPISGHPGLAPQSQQISEFIGHKYGINCVAFSPSSKYVVSVGTQHDMIVNVWDWKNNIKIASNKVSTKVKAVAFAENGSYFVTVGNRHVKFWYLEYGKSKYKEAVPLMGRSAILGEQRNNYFCDVACGKAQCGDSTYAITRSGLLCEFNNRRLLDKWVGLRTTSANCITVGENYIFVGCAEGIIRCFEPSTLNFITTLPRTHYLGVDLSLATSISHTASPPRDAKYPDAVAITYNETTNKLTTIYNDHSIYIWDVFNIKRVGKSFSFLYHSACIWGVEMPPSNCPLPSGSFLTCSSDDTIRIWTLDKLTNDRNNHRHHHHHEHKNNDDDDDHNIHHTNIYSNELLKIVYVDKDLNYIKDLDLSMNNTSDKQQQQQQQQQQQETSYDGRNGVRCIRISPDGRNLASGDRSGNIRIHDTKTMRELCKIEAHDAEVLCLEYFNSPDKNINLMASGSRDRLLHVFDVNKGYEFLQTLDDHSSSITAVRFLNNQNHIQMASCGADKSLIFRTLSQYNDYDEDFDDHTNSNNDDSKPHFIRGHNIASKTTLYDMEIDNGQKHVLTACQDRNVRCYSANTGKHTKSFKGSTGDDGTLIKVVMDKSGIYLATSCTDKSLSVYDYYSGECMATMSGHSELATGLRFTNDCRRLISASGDGCIFVWRVPHDMVVTMHARLSQQAMRQGKQLDSELLSDNNLDIYDTTNRDTNYRFSIGQLPQWAKKQLIDDNSPPTSLTKNVAIPKGRWAQRAEENLLDVKSYYSSLSSTSPTSSSNNNNNNNNSNNTNNNSGSSNPNNQSERRLFDSDGSRDSSLEETTRKSTVLLSKQVTIRREVLSDNLTDTGFESTAHDGDIDSDNDYRHRPLYYPTQSDSHSGSEFTVTNIDVDELRKSQRKKKPPPPPLPPLTTTTVQSPTQLKPPLPPPQILIQEQLSTCGSQDTDDDVDDDDDGDVSTPSGENTDRNPMSLLSLSSESLDQLIYREKYLQSTFETMSGNNNNNNNNNKSTSISSKFLTKTSDVNMAAINALKQTKSDPETLKKRQLLSKRIAETKKKLESVGHSSPLKYSQSVHDLSPIPERDKYTKKKQVYVDETRSSNLRRSCSLSDLSMQKMTVGKNKVEVSGKKSQSSSSRSNSRYIKNNASSSSSSAMMRSQSIGVLNQSDSDTDIQMINDNNNSNKKVSRLMRPTISSYNKINNKIQQRNKKQSQSLTTIDIDSVSTSDDDLIETTTTATITTTKPIVPPRNRNIGLLDSGGGSGGPPLVMPRHLNNKDKQKNTTRSLKTDGDDLIKENLELATVEMSHQLCNDVIKQLTTAADNVVDLYNRLNDVEKTTIPQSSSSSSSQSASATEADMIKNLEMSICKTLKILHDCIAKKLRQNNDDNNTDVNQTDTVKKLNDLVLKGTSGSNSVVNIMEQYSDILLDMVQQKIHNNSHI